ncbi:MAG: hypothetical protein KME30_19000 [Iphinoe sp. HA4291-MV1]|jgi:hypothetical protein|nr:hypothetical protein [Iphinoe sp. HA4291-MV1]
MKYDELKRDLSPDAKAASFLLNIDDYRQFLNDAHAKDDGLLMSEVRSHHNGRADKDKPTVTLWWE